MWSKLQIIDEAFSELAIQGYVFDISPDEQQAALRRLDVMMATWEKKGVRVGYAMPANPQDSNIDSASGLPNYAVEAVYLSLAIRLAASYGKQISMDTRKLARDGYDLLLIDAAQPQEQQMRGSMVSGAGNKGIYSANSRFFSAPTNNPLGNTQGGDLLVIPE